MPQVLDNAENFGYNYFDELVVWCKTLNNARYVKN